MGFEPQCLNLYHSRPVQHGHVHVGSLRIPVMFLTRSNLDPFNQYTEDQIWDALERTHMKECVSKELTESFAGISGLETQ